MNCRECRDWLQLELDGVPAAPGALAGHLALCGDCRRLHAAARRLRHGLQLLAPPHVPAGLGERIVRGVLIDRGRRRRRRRRLGLVALAASALLVVFGARLMPRHAPGPPREEAARPVKPLPMREALASAADGVVDWAARAAGDAADQTRLLLPVVDVPPLPAPELAGPLESPARSLEQAGKGMTASLKPVADSAVRAFALFRRELPGGRDKKPDL
jgi:hypothetical protein